MSLETTRLDIFFALFCFFFKKNLLRRTKLYIFADRIYKVNVLNNLIKPEFV